jgi:hypothetical protein
MAEANHIMVDRRERERERERERGREGPGITLKGISPVTFFPQLDPIS